MSLVMMGHKILGLWEGQSVIDWGSFFMQDRRNRAQNIDPSTLK